MGRSHIAWAFALAAVAGCGPTLGTRGRLAQQAEPELDCGSVEVQQLAENAFEVRGCGRMMELTDADPGSGRRFVPMTPAATLAVGDLHCGIADIAPTGEQSVARRTLAGCGQRARYLLACAGDAPCHWMLEAPPVAISAPPSGATP